MYQTQPHLHYGPGGIDLESVRNAHWLETDKAMFRAQCREMVDRGAAVARKINKRWARILDLDVFQIASGQACVLAQLAQKDMKQFRDDLIDLLEIDPTDMSARQIRKAVEEHAEYTAGLRVLERNNLASDDVTDYMSAYCNWEHWHGFCLARFPFANIEYVTEYLDEGDPKRYQYFDPDQHWAILQECWMERIALDRGMAVPANV